MKISIIIIVKNDPDVRLTLESLVKINYPKIHEIVVVDASDKTSLKNIKEEFNSVRWFYYENKSNKSWTVAEQRNLAVTKAEGEIIVSIDAGCIPADGWLENLSEPILSGEEYIVSGVVRAIDPRSVNNISDENKIYAKYIPECAGINFAISRNVFEKIGLFDEIFFHGSDVDFTWRAIDAGYRILMAPQSVVYHDWGDFKDEVKRSVKYGMARVRLYKKHKNRLKNLLGFDIRTLVYPAFLLGSPIALVFPWYLLLLLIPMYRSRNNKPIKFTFLSIVYGFGVLKGLVRN